MEFAATAWSPWLEKDIEIMEKVQRRAVRAVSNAKGNTYEGKMEDVSLTSLKERRTRGDAIETFKTLKGFNNVNRSEWFSIQQQEETRLTRTNSNVVNGQEQRKADMIIRLHTRNEIRSNFFTVRATRIWNDLPDEVKNQKSVNAFKSAYDRWKKNKIQFL